MRAKMAVMRFRKLRIAWSVGWGLLAVLLMVLWVRSYWWSDGIRVYHTPNRCAQLKSLGAAVHLYVGHYSGGDSGVRLFSVRVTPMPDESVFDWKPFPECRVSVPHYCLLVIIGAVSTVPWIRWSKRFTLRTLLIATTLVAVALRVAVYAIKN
jgi:hypothetical protein